MTHSSRTRWTRALMAVVAAATLGCGGGYDAAGPTAGPVARQFFYGDPVGDTTGTGAVHWDVTGMMIARDAESITVQLDLLHPVISPTGGDPNAMVAFVDFDVDQDPATGIASAVDEFRTDGRTTGLGADYRLDLTNYAADSSVAITDTAGRVVGRVKPAIRARFVMVRIPLALLGNDDGVLNAAAIVGTVGHPSDFMPNDGHLTVTRQ